MRALVQEPRKTVSMTMSRSGVPGVRSMYASAFSAACFELSSVKPSGSGTFSPSGRPWPGFVPQVTNGVSAEPSISTTVSKVAPSSVGSVFQYSTAASQSAPFGAYSRPLTYSNVVSSGATMPARAPASMDMLQMVMRASIDSLRIASPRYSMMWPCPPPVPILAMMARIRSFALTPSASSPVTSTAIVLNGLSDRVCVAITCSTSLVPMPMAMEPNAPCVEVCESPHTIVMPGWVIPSCGPTVWTMPCLTSPIGCSVTPNSSQFLRSVSTWMRDVGSAISSRLPFTMPSVGTLWSSVARCSSGWRMVRPAMRSPSNACGEVTSWSSWKSM